MATTWHVRPGATGANDGTSKTNAWTSIESAILARNADTIVNGDDVVLWASGTDTIASSLTTLDDADTLTDYGVRLRWYAVNDTTGLEDGTKYVIDGQSTAVNIFTINRIDQNEFWNVEFKNPTTRPLYMQSAGASSTRFYHCVFRGGQYNTLTSPIGVRFIGCLFINQSADSVINPGAGDYVNCLFIGSAYGVYNTASNVGSNWRNCVFANMSTAAVLHAGVITIFGSTFYNTPLALSIGSATDTGHFNVRKCLFHTVTTVASPAAGTGNSIYREDCEYYAITAKSSGTFSRNIITGVDETLGSDPLTNAAGGNFMKTASASNRSVGSKVGTDGVNFDYSGVGLDPQEPTVPAVGDVRDGVFFGVGSADEGTLVLPTEDETALNVGFGSGGTEFIGNRRQPTVDIVKDGELYGPSDSLEGEYAVSAQAFIPWVRRAG